MDKIKISKAFEGCRGYVDNKLIDKIDELVEEWNSHKEWHKRFFDKYNKEN